MLCCFVRCGLLPPFKGLLPAKRISRKRFRFRLDFLRCFRRRSARRSSRRASRRLGPFRRLSRLRLPSSVPFLTDAYRRRHDRWPDSDMAACPMASLLGCTWSRAERARVCRRREWSAVEWALVHLLLYETRFDLVFICIWFIYY